MTVEEDMLLTVKKLWEEGKFYKAHEVLEDVKDFPKFPLNYQFDV